MRASVKTKDLFTCTTPYLKELFDESLYPWDMLDKIGGYIEKLIKTGIAGYTEIKEGVLVGDGTKIHPSAVIIPPAVIGRGCEIRPSAYLRGNVILGEGCVVGNSTEIKNSILLEGTQVPHYNYVGDSILGVRSHMGAGAVCSNLKSGGGEVTVRGETDHKTGRRKLGAVLGDGADIGCGCVMNPGTVVGRNTSVYPLTSLRGVYPENCIVKGERGVFERKA